MNPRTHQENAIAPIPTGWREVFKEEFYRVIGPQNVHPSPQGRYQYTSLFKSPHGDIRGKSIGYFPEGIGIEITKYLLPIANGL